MCLWQWIMFDVNPHFCYWGIHSVKQLDIELIRNWINSIQYQLCHDLEVNRIMHGITMITFFFFFFYWHLPRRDFQPIKMLKNVLRWTSNFERWTSNLRGGHQILRSGHQFSSSGHQILRGGHQILRGGHQLSSSGHQILKGEWQNRENRRWKAMHGSG
jgi:hypothetical protein